MKKVVLTYDSQGGVEVEQEVLAGFANIIKIPCITENDLIDNCKDADAVITSYEPFTDRVMENLPKLKIIAFKAIGFNSVDIDAANKRGVAVTNIPNYCIDEVADHTVMLMLSINRRLLQFNKSVQQDRVWQYDICRDIKRFGKCMVGLLGFGHIPRLLTERLKGFGTRVVVYDPFIDETEIERYGAEKVELEYLYRNADYISCHLPLNKHTEHFVNDKAFEIMKKDAVFINTSRGKVVDETALIKAIDRGKIGFAALDVLTEEHPDMNRHPLVGRDNVILTPHVAFYSKDSVVDAKIQSAENVLYYLKGEYQKCNIVNNVRGEYLEKLKK